MYIGLVGQSCPWVHFVWPDPTQPISWLTQPNPLQVEKSRPNPTQTNPTQPNPWVNPTHGQLCSRLQKLKLGQWPRPRLPITYLCIVFVRAFTSYRLKKFKWRYQGVPKFGSRSRDFVPTFYGLLVVGPQFRTFSPTFSRICYMGSGSTSNTMFHGPQECSPQTASWSVQPFLHSEAESCRAADRLDWRTDTAIIGNKSVSYAFDAA